MKRFRYKNIAVDFPGKENVAALCGNALTLGPCRLQTKLCNAVQTLCVHHCTRLVITRLPPTFLSRCCPVTPYTELTPTTPYQEEVTEPELDLQQLKQQLKEQLSQIEEIEAQEQASLSREELDQAETQLKEALAQLHDLKNKLPK